MDALTLLLERRSTHMLTAPGPSEEELETILRAGLRAPDFQRLRPYRFLIAEGGGRDRLGALLSDAAEAAGHPPDVVERALRMPHRAPLVIVVVAQIKPHAIVKPFEQQLSAGCAVMAMQQAAVALGYGGVWRSGWPMFDRGLHAMLGLAETDQIVGFLYLGTPGGPEPKAPPPDDLATLVERL